MAILTNQAKSASTPTNLLPGAQSQTWDEHPETWDQNNGTWNNPETHTNQVKNVSAPTNQTKH